MILRLLALFAGLVLLAACEPADPAIEAKPALWEVTAPDGQQAWLFGTIHSLPDNVDWHGPVLSAALAQSGVLVAEIADLGNRTRAAAAFESRALTPGLDPLSRRLNDADRGRLLAVYDRTGLDDADLHDIEDWAAALMIAAALREHDPANGVDRALLAEAGEKVSLESYEGQYVRFDRLSAQDQRTLLQSVLDDADASPEADLLAVWARGDLAAIESEAQGSFLADANLRQALLVDRNQDWLEQLIPMILAGRRPFVAVGTAHLVGTDGLPALLESRGYSVARIQ